MGAFMMVSPGPLGLLVPLPRKQQTNSLRHFGSTRWEWSQLLLGFGWATQRTEGVFLFHETMSIH